MTALIQCTLIMTIPSSSELGPSTTRRAIVAAEGTFTYGDLLAASERAASELLDGVDDLNGARVVFLVPGGFQYVAIQWAIWRAGGVAVPLALSETEREIRYKINDTEPTVLIAHPDYADILRPFAEEGGSRFLTTTELLGGDCTAALPDVDPERAAMILYTSGTTSDPKGVVATHRNVEAQVESLVEAWAGRRKTTSSTICRSITSTALSTPCRAPCGSGRRASFSPGSTPSGSGRASSTATSPCTWPFRRCTRRSSRRGSPVLATGRWRRRLRARTCA